MVARGAAAAAMEAAVASEAAVATIAAAAAEATEAAGLTAEAMQAAGKMAAPLAAAAQAGETALEERPGRTCAAAEAVALVRLAPRQSMASPAPPPLASSVARLGARSPAMPSASRTPRCSRTSPIPSARAPRRSYRPRWSSKASPRRPPPHWKCSTPRTCQIARPPPGGSHPDGSRRYHANGTVTFRSRAATSGRSGWRAARRLDRAATPETVARAAAAEVPAATVAAAEAAVAWAVTIGAEKRAAHRPSCALWRRSCQA